VLSLHVLMYPKEHPLQHPWIRQMRTLSPALKREIRSFGFLYSDITADFMLPESADAPQSFEEALQAFASMPAKRAQYEIARPTFFYLEEDAGGPESMSREDVRARVTERVSSYDPELAAQLLDDPAAVQARIVEMLAGYWEQSFAEEWQRLEPILAEEVERASGRDPIEILGEVRAELVVDPKERLLDPALGPPPRGRRRRRQPAAADPERLRLAARPRELRRALAARGALPAGDHAARPRRHAAAGRARPGAPRRRRPDAASDPPARGRAAALDGGARAARRPVRVGLSKAPARPDRRGPASRPSGRAGTSSTASSAGAWRSSATSYSATSARRRRAGGCSRR